MTVESRSSSELSGLSFAFASLSGTALAASVLCCLFSVGQLESTVLALNRIRDFSTGSSRLHLDCGICLCVVTRSSTTLLMNCGWGTSTVFCVVCACSCGTRCITATVSSKATVGTRTSTICSSTTLARASSAFAKSFSRRVSENSHFFS